MSEGQNGVKNFGLDPKADSDGLRRELLERAYSARLCGGITEEKYQEFLASDGTRENYLKIFGLERVLEERKEIPSIRDLLEPL